MPFLIYPQPACVGCSVGRFSVCFCAIFSHLIVWVELLLSEERKAERGAETASFDISTVAESLAEPADETKDNNYY